MRLQKARKHTVLIRKVRILFSLKNDSKYLRYEYVSKIYVQGEFDKVNKKIDDVEARLDNKIDQVEIRLNNKIDTKIAEVNKKIDDVEIRLNNRIDQLEAKVDKGFEEIKALFGQLQNQLSTITKS